MADGSSQYTAMRKGTGCRYLRAGPQGPAGLGLSIGRTPVSEKEQLRCGFELAWLTEAANTPPCGKAQAAGICGLARKDRQAWGFP